MDKKDKLSPEALFQSMETSSQNIINALLSAAQCMPPDLPEAEKEQFKRIFALAESLKERVDQISKKRE